MKITFRLLSLEEANKNHVFVIDGSIDTDQFIGKPIFRGHEIIGRIEKCWIGNEAVWGEANVNPIYYYQ